MSILKTSLNPIRFRLTTLLLFVSVLCLCSVVLIETYRNKKNCLTGVWYYPPIGQISSYKEELKLSVDNSFIKKEIYLDREVMYSGRFSESDIDGIVTFVFEQMTSDTNTVEYNAIYRCRCAVDSFHHLLIVDLGERSQPVIRWHAYSPFHGDEQIKAEATRLNRIQEKLNEEKRLEK